MTREDLPFANAYGNDLETTLLQQESPPQPEDLAVRLARYERQLAEEDPAVCWFAIEFEGRYVGGCGLLEIDRFNSRAQIGIGIGDPESRGKGLGRDALETLVEVAFKYHNLQRVWLTVTAANERAIRCYLAAGFVEEGRLRRHAWVAGEYVDYLLMGRLR